MPVFAFVVFKDEHEKARLLKLIKAGLFKSRIGTALYYFLNKKRFGKETDRINAGPDIEIVSAEMPFPASLLSSFDTSHIGNIIKRIGNKKGWEKCFLPGDVCDLPGLGQFSSKTIDVGIIFKSLLIPLLNIISKSREIKLEDIETTIISGENMSELLAIVSQLEPYIKYINVAAENKKAAENELSGFCSDTGLSAFISSDYKSVLRNSELIINLDKEINLNNYKIKPNSIIINLSIADNSKMQGDFTVINGLLYSFKNDLYSRLGKEICRCFDKDELTNILMAIKAGLLDRSSGDNDEVSCGCDYSLQFVENVNRVFRSCGGSITGLLGRRGIIN